MSDDTLFPDLFVPWEQVTRYEIAAFESALDGAHDERDMQRFLEGHPRMLIPQISGEHGAWVIPQKRLGSEHITDFLIAEKTSGGFVWYAVELERPQAKLFNKDGDSSRTLNHALRQIGDWRDWLSQNRDYATKPREQSGLGLVDIDPELEGLIIIGRDADLDQSTTARRRRLMRERRVEIETYDWLLAQARARLQRHIAAAAHAANEINDWLNMSALSESEVPGPVRSMYFSNIDPAEHKTDNMFVPASNYTQDIPAKYHDFVREVERILKQRASWLSTVTVTYDKMHDYVSIVPSSIITFVQTEQIAQAAKDSSIKYLFNALVYTG
jgi:hypothetical protein